MPWTSRIYIFNKKKAITMHERFLFVYIYFEAVLVQSRHELTCFAVQWRTPFFLIFFFLAISKPLVSVVTCNDLFCSCVEEHFFSSYLQTTGISFFPKGSLHKLCKDNDLDSSRNDNWSAKLHSYMTLYHNMLLNRNKTNIFSLVDGSRKW